MKKFILAIALFSVVSAPAALIELQNAQEFNNLVQNSKVPVVVQFAAYWCGPCQTLKATLAQVAQSYSDSQVRIAYVDAYVNKSLGSYIMGGYPTTRAFKNGSVTQESFVGNKPASSVKAFIDSVISEEEVMDEVNFCPVM